MIQTAGSTTVGGETIEFGQPVRTRGAFLAFPVGTVVRHRNDSIWTRETGGAWRQEGYATAYATDHSMILGHNSLVSMPVEVAVIDDVEFCLGDLMTYTQLSSAPVGTVIADGSGVGALGTKGDDGRWHWSSGTATYTSSLAVNYNRLVSLPGYEESPETAPETTGWTTSSTVTYTGMTSTTGMTSGMDPGYRPLRSPLLRRTTTETLHTLKQRLGTEAVAVAQRFGKPLGPVFAALVDLDAAPTPSTGGIYSTQTPFPVGTVVTYQEPGHSSYTMWLMRDTGLERVLGSTNLDDLNTVTVREVPALPDYVAEANEAERIAAWKAEVWKKGWGYKTDNNWCSAYEDLLRDLGITAASVGAPEPVHPGVFGPFVTTDWNQRALLPVGSIVARVGEGPDDWRITAKTENGWSKICGASAFGVLRTHLLFDGNGSGITADAALLDLMPTGSRLDHNGSEWSKLPTGRWTAYDGPIGVLSTAFDSEITITRIGSREVGATPVF